MLRNALTALMLLLVVGTVDSRVPHVGDHVGIKLNIGPDAYWYAGNVTNISSTGMGLNVSGIFTIKSWNGAQILDLNGTQEIFVGNGAIAEIEWL